MPSKAVGMHPAGPVPCMMSFAMTPTINPIIAAQMICIPLHRTRTARRAGEIKDWGIMKRRHPQISQIFEKSEGKRNLRIRLPQTLFFAVERGFGCLESRKMEFRG